MVYKKAAALKKNVRGVPHFSLSSTLHPERVVELSGAQPTETFIMKIAELLRSPSS